MVHYDSEESKQSCKSVKNESTPTDMRKSVLAGSVVVVAAIILAFSWKSFDDGLDDTLKTILDGLVNTERRHTSIYPRVAIGYGSCKDLVFEALELGIFNCSRTNGEAEIEVIESYEDLEKSFCYYFRHGAATERYTPNVTLFDELVEKIEKLNSSHASLGGNAAVIGKRFALSGFDVLLATSATPDFKKLLPDSLSVAGEVTKKDDIHLVFEYKTGDKCGSFTSPRANRFILHHDVQNPKFTSMNVFEQKLKEFRPHLLVISGLQILDNVSLRDELINEKVTQISRQMKSQPLPTKIHFEMASIINKNLLLKMINLIVPFANSLGMNEQELANIYAILSNDIVVKAVDSNPKIDSTLDKLRFIYSRLQEIRIHMRESRLLTRLHVHTLAYQVIMVSRLSDWKDCDAAAARASLTANTYVCDTTNVDLSKSSIEMDSVFNSSSLPGSHMFELNIHEPVTCWNETLYHICVAPNMVCTKAKQTAGCGDNISAAGLTAQI